MPAAAFAQQAANPQSDVLVSVPALTPVMVRLEDEISSNKNKPGDRFRITVAEDVRIGDVVVIPAGSAGEGEVIHAAKPKAGGVAGELILAARFVHVGDVEVRLRSFALGVAGADHSEGALATAFVAGPFAMFVHGGVVIVPRQTLGLAKTALEFRLPAVAPAPSPVPNVETNEEVKHESKAD
jgi:hypothetical protein